MNSTLIGLDFIQSIFIPNTWDNLKIVSICGNIEEPTMHPNLPEIASHFIAVNNDLTVTISTNGSTRTEKYFKELGELSASVNHRIRVVFAIDGLEDTNHLYRIGSHWQKIQRNYKAYIAAGGYAIWQFVVLAHNKHQLEEVRTLQKTEGFKAFRLRYSGRPAEDKGVTVMYTPNNHVICKSLHLNDIISPRIFINHFGQMSPCCYIDISNKRHAEIYTNILSTIDEKYYNLYKNTVDDILDGPWFDWLYHNFNNSGKCIFHCKRNITDQVTTIPND